MGVTKSQHSKLLKIIGRREQSRRKLRPQPGGKPVQYLRQHSPPAKMLTAHVAGAIQLPESEISFLVEIVREAGVRYRPAKLAWLSLKLNLPFKLPRGCSYRLDVEKALAFVLARRKLGDAGFPVNLI